MTHCPWSRLIYVSLVDLSLPNGPGVNEREFALTLRRRFGQRAVLVIPQPRHDLPELRQLDAIVFRNPARWNVWRTWQQQRELRAVLDRLLSEQSDAALICRLSLFPWAIAGLEHRQVPLFIKTQGEVDGFRRNRGLKGLTASVLAPLNARWYRQVLQRSWGIDCCTPQLADRLRQDWGVSESDLCLVENATNVQRFAPQPSDHAKRRLGLERFQSVLGFVGGAAADRGGMEILATVARLQHDFPRLGAVIVGPDPEYRLQREAHRLGLRERVILTGLVPYDRVPGYVNSFDVAFALDDPRRFAHVGNSYQKIRQYLACGKPVITCVADPNSFLLRERLASSVTAGDLDAIQRATREILLWNDQQRAAHADRAVGYVRQHLSTEATLDQRLQFWQRQASRRTAQRQAA